MFTDFEYDGLRLSDMGFIVCTFDNAGLNTVSNGSQITFNTTSTLNGEKYDLSGTQYDECLETSLQICKNPCYYDNLEISLKELEYITSWLNRKEFHKFKIFDNDYMDLYFEASFNISKIENYGKIIGVELDMKTNRPFALKEPCTITINNLIEGGERVITDISDEEGYIYPDMEITINEDGNLSIYNALEDRTMYIRNCTAGEVITLQYPIIETSLESHAIQNDFNWNFFRIANTFKNKRNKLTISIPCTIKLTYSPIIKIGI